MANHSAEYPAGYLSHEVAASWFGITGSNGNYQANQGQEKIPANWACTANILFGAKLIVPSYISTDERSNTLTKPIISSLMLPLPPACIRSFSVSAGMSLRLCK